MLQLVKKKSMCEKKTSIFRGLTLMYMRLSLMCFVKQVCWKVLAVENRFPNVIINANFSDSGSI